MTTPVHPGTSADRAESTATTAGDGSAGQPGPGSAAAGSAAAAIARTVARLRATARTRRTHPREFRIAQLHALERLLREREDEIVKALAEDLGRSDAESWLADVGPTLAESADARRHLARWMRPRRVGVPLRARPAKAWVEYEPLGVVLVIGPWNYPVFLTLGPLVGAIAAGNCVVVKPSEHAPAVGALLARLLPEYLDPDVVAVVEGGPDETQVLLDQGFDHAFFTGGPEIGKAVMAGAARHLTPVTLELGGKSPTIVTAHANLPVAARRIAWTKLTNSGQTCIAPDYVLVERSVRDAFVPLLVAALAEFGPGSAGGPGTGLPIVNERHAGRLAGLLDDSGGEVVAGGAVDVATHTAEPTVVLDPDPDSRLMREEIFGPLLPVVTVDSLAQAVEFVVDRPKPLAAYLFSDDAAEQRQVVAEIAAGGVLINHALMHCLVSELPFGGVGNSGMGAYHGQWGFETFSHRKPVLKKPSRPDPAIGRPPYTPAKLRVLRRFFR